MKLRPPTAEIFGITLKMGIGTSKRNSSCIDPPVFPTHKEIKREQRFIDFGTSTGVYSLVAASVGCKSILAFEPDVMQFSALTKNVRLNQTFNIEIYNKFVFSRVALFSRYSNHLKKNKPRIISYKRFTI